MFPLLNDSFAFIVTLAYLGLVTGTGACLTCRLPLSHWQRLPAAFVAGSIALGMAFTVLALLQMVTPAATLAVLAIALMLSIYGIPKLGSSWREFASRAWPWQSRLSGRQTAVLLAILAVIAFYLLLSLTPPRSADAMRYHLAQLKDIVHTQGVVFRPYVHYNFPLYFSVLLLPVYQACGGVGIQIAHCIYLFLALSLTLVIAREYGVRHPVWVLLLLLLVPLSYHEAHEACNDWAVVVYVMSALWLVAPIAVRDHDDSWSTVLGFLALGFALGVKYHAVLFLPWIMMVAWPRLLEMLKSRQVGLLCLALGGMVVIAAPWYVRNWWNTGNPCWPLMLKLFPGGQDYLTEVATAYAAEQAGVHSLVNLLGSIKGLLISPYIPGILWLLAAFALIWRHKHDPLKLRYGLPCFFAVWWVLQPVWYLRFSIFVLPFAVVLSVLVFERLRELKSRIYYRACAAGFVLVLLYGAAIGAWYSAGYLAFYANRQLADYHRATWFYDEYAWINRCVPEHQRLLVIVSAGQTYYLDRSYLRADPWLSGAVAWPQLQNVQDLERILREQKISHVLYEDRDWHAAPGGSEMMRIIDAAREGNLLVTQWERPVRLYTSRLRGLYEDSRALLLRVGLDMPVAETLQAIH